MANNDGSGASKASRVEGNRQVEQGNVERRRRMRLPARLVAVSWRDLLVIGVPVLLITAAAAWIAVKFVRPAPPNTIIISAGAPGGSNLATAEKYRKIIEAHGVKVQILESRGSLENLQRLANPAFKLDVAFVQGGLTDGVNITGLMSLGSMSARDGLLSQPRVGGAAVAVDGQAVGDRPGGQRHAGADAEAFEGQLDGWRAHRAP